MTLKYEISCSERSIQYSIVRYGIYREYGSTLLASSLHRIFIAAKDRNDDSLVVTPAIRKNMVPTVPSLEKNCEAFGITLSQLFAGDNTPIALTAKQKEMLERWDRLNEEQQAVIFQLIDKML